MGFFNKLFGKRSSAEKTPEPCHRPSLMIADEIGAVHNSFAARVITEYRQKPAIGLFSFLGTAAALAMCRVMVPVSVEVSPEDIAAMLSGQSTVTIANDIKMKPIAAEDPAGFKKYTAYLSRRDIPDEILSANSWLKMDFTDLVRLATAPGNVIVVNPGSLDYEVNAKQFLFILNSPMEKPGDLITKKEPHYPCNEHKCSGVKLELPEDSELMTNFRRQLVVLCRLPLADRVYAAVNTAGKKKTLAVIVNAPEKNFTEIESKIRSIEEFTALKMPLELLPFEPLKKQLDEIGCGMLHHSPETICGGYSFELDGKYFDLQIDLDEDGKIIFCQVNIKQSYGKAIGFNQETVMRLAEFLYDTYQEESFVLGLGRLLSEELETCSPFEAERNFTHHLRNLGGSPFPIG